MEGLGRSDLPRPSNVMPSKKPQLINGEIYHIILRGVGDSLIFKDVNDYYRGIFSVYEFNNAIPVDIWLRRQQRKKEKITENIRPSKVLEGQTFQYLDKRDKFVEVLVFCFMPNHIHLLARQLKDNGVSNFMQKVGTGYAVYFNKKYHRKGHLFNNFKAVHIETDDQLKNVVTYFHCNPISLIEPGFKDKGIEHPEKVKEFLENYKWSSYQDYIGIKNFHYVTEREFISEIMGGPEGCRAEVENWILHKKDLNDFYNVLG